ncbi:copper chaperone PCu(A)C [Oceanibium sediminis]|uniref:copper chaperone PCu(A)C n=1 Tax=Oceanibium sediminis TaxID=2026339 RepID=UPI000DD42550|nr:copper chaperone PCu(A)C [Oceanibium sediminis]
MRIALGLGLALGLFSLPVLAMEDTVHHVHHGDLVISDMHTLETPPRATSAAGYLIIENTGDTDDVLLTVEGTAASTMLHKTETDAAGVARMVHQMNGIPLPAGQTVTLEPGALHIMFMGLEQPFSADSEPEVTLVFRDAGPVTVTLDLRSRTGDAVDSGHGHGN